MAVAVARSNLMFGTASTLSPPKIRRNVRRPLLRWRKHAWAQWIPKSRGWRLKLEVTAQALVRHAPVEDQHGDMTFFASQHEAGPEFGFQQADHTRADLIERLLHEFWSVQRENAERTDSHGCFS